MVVGRAMMEHCYAVQMKTDVDFQQEVKKKLIMDMAEFILKNNLVEFTQYDDPITMTKQIAVRAYLAPNDQVKILRLANKVV
jgi:predicted house-cleaning noncanonical NTP pyrophosphatase (MazG superfamily)